MGNLSLTYAPEGSPLSVRANLSVSKDARDRFNALPDYELLDLSANYQISDQLDLYWRVENLTDENYFEVTGFHTSGRAGYAGVRVNF